MKAVDASSNSSAWSRQRLGGDAVRAAADLLCERRRRPTDRSSWWRLGETSGTTAANQVSGGDRRHVRRRRDARPDLAAGDRHGEQGGRVQRQHRPRLGGQSSSALSLTNSLSLEAWIKPTSLPSSGVFRSVLTKAESYSLQFNGPRLELTIIQSGTRRRLQAPSGAIVAGGTYHVVGTFDGATQRLYVNGAQVASAALTGSASVTSTRCSIGSWDGGSEFFAGTIDEPAVYNAVLSADAGRQPLQSRHDRLSAGPPRAARGSRPAAR